MTSQAVAGRTSRLCVWTACFIVTGAAWLPEAAAAGASPRTFQLSIMGDPGVQVRGSCTVRDAQSDREVAIEGAVPMTRTMTGEDVACRFETDGYVVVERRQSEPCRYEWRYGADRLGPGEVDGSRLTAKPGVLGSAAGPPPAHEPRLADV